MEMNDSLIGNVITEVPMDDPSELRISSRPKLHRFVDYDREIRYLKEIGRGAESVAFLVIVNGKEYAMKWY